MTRHFRIPKGSAVWKVHLVATDMQPTGENWEIHIADEPIPTLVEWRFDESDLWNKTTVKIVGDMTNKPSEGQIVILPAEGMTRNCNAFLAANKDIIKDKDWEAK